MKPTSKRTSIGKTYRSTNNNSGTKKRSNFRANDRLLSVGSIYSRMISCRALNSFWVLIALVGYIGIVTAALVSGPTAQASDPTSGTIAPTSSQVIWHGTGVGSGALNAPIVLPSGEDLCQEGVN
jgi:hypothetical protein